MKRFALMLVLVLTVGTIGWGEINHDPPVSSRIRSRFQNMMRLWEPEPPSTIWSYIGDDHAAVSPPSLLVVEHIPVSRNCMCDRLSWLLERGDCPFCGRRGVHPDWAWCTD